MRMDDQIILDIECLIHAGATEAGRMAAAKASSGENWFMAQLQMIGPVSHPAGVHSGAPQNDAGCSSNSSRLFHTLNADEIRAKGDVKTTDWTRVG